MIDKVMIYDIKLGKEYVSKLDINQLCGRAGRTYNKFQQGQTYIFGKQEDEQQINEYYYGKENIVSSTLTDIDTIAFHILPDINKGLIKNKENIDSWYKNTLAYDQQNVISIQQLYNFLIQTKSIDENFNVLLNGQLSIKYYYSPQRIKVLNEKLDNLINLNDFSTMAFAWLFSYYNGRQVYHPLYYAFNDLRSSKYYLNDELFDFFVYYLILNNKHITKIGSFIGKTRKGLPRLISVLKKLCEVKEIKIEKKLKLIETMLYYRVSERQAKMMQDLQLYQKKTIVILMQLEIYSFKELKERINLVEEYCDKNFLRKCLQLIKDKENGNRKSCRT